MRSLVFEPLIPMALWAALALVGIVLLVVYGRSSFARLSRLRWAVMMALMGAAVALPLAILLNPLWLERIPPPAGKPSLTILIDGTQSMAHGDGTHGGSSRFQEAERIATVISDRLGNRYDVHLRTFADKTSPVSLAELATFKPNGEVTDLAAAIGETLQSDRAEGQAIVLLSDGIHNAAGGTGHVIETAARARAVNAPIYTRTLGGAASVCDLAVELRSPQELTFVDQKVPIRAVLHSSGLAGQKATVHLFDEQEHVLGTKTATLNIGKPVEVQFEVERDRSGVFRYEVRAEPLPGEVTTADNQATFMLRVIDEPIRVLILEGKPYWDTKFLLRTLTSDRSVELVSVVKLADKRFIERTLKRPVADKADSKTAADKPDPTKKPASEHADPTKPADGLLSKKSPIQVDASPNTAAQKASAEHANFSRSQDWKIIADGSTLLTDQKSLSTYQVVILGRDAETFLTDEAINQVKHWLRESGGALVCFRGAPTAQINQRLAQILPVRWEGARESRFHMRLTEQGRDLRWLPSDDDQTDADPLLLMPSLATSGSAARKPVARRNLGRGRIRSERKISGRKLAPLWSGRTRGRCRRFRDVALGAVAAEIRLARIHLWFALAKPRSLVGFESKFAPIPEVEIEQRSCSLPNFRPGGGHAANSRDEFLG